MRNEALANIEKANHDTGLEAAFSALGEEVRRINAGPNTQDNTTQLAELEAELTKNKLLPELAVMWAIKNRGLVGEGDRISLNDLDEFRNRSTTDTISKAMATSLMEQHAKLRQNWWDMDDLNISKADLDEEKKHIDRRHPDMLRTETYAKFADQLKENNYALFDKLSGGDKDKTNVTPRDMSLALEANSAAKKFGQEFLTQEEVNSIKEVKLAIAGANIDTPYKDFKTHAFTYDRLQTLPPRQKAAWEIEDGDKKDASVAAGLSAGAAAVAALITDGAKKIGEAAGAVAGEMYAQKLPPEDQISTYNIEAGQGFDRIARDVLRREANRANGSEIRKFDEADVVALSSEIAKFNGMERKDVLRLDQKSLNIPPLNWAQISAR